MTLQYEITYYWPISLSSEVNRIIYNNQYRNVCEKKERLDHVSFGNDLSLSNPTTFYIFGNDFNLVQLFSNSYKCLHTRFDEIGTSFYQKISIYNDSKFI